MTSPSRKPLSLDEERLCNVLNHWRLKISSKYHNLRDAFRSLKGNSSGDLFISKDDFLKDCTVLLGDLTTPALSTAMFEMFDRDNDGVISWDEFQDATRSEGIAYFRSERFNQTLGSTANGQSFSPVRDQQQQVYEQQDGVTARAGLSALKERNYQKMETLRANFPGLDRRDSEAINMEDFHDILSQNGIRMIPQEEERLFSKLDRSGCGSIKAGDLYRALQETSRSSIASH